MTDDTREQQLKDLTAQINKDAQDFANKYYSYDESRSSTARTGYHSGAFGQHPIAYSQGLAEGRRQAVEDALKELAHYKDLFEYKEDYLELKKELEKLKQ